MTVTVAAKSTSVLVGWKDPMIYQLERAAPTPTQEGIMVTRQWLASAKVTGRIADLTNAFGQARKTSRKNKLARKLPPGVTHPAVGPRQLLRVETEIYGLASGPSWLRASLAVDLLAAGHVKNPYDNCLVTLFSSDETSEGQLLLDFDDFIEGGKDTHRKTMEGFCDKYLRGKAVDLMSAGKEGTRFAGDVSCKTPSFSSLCRWTKMSSPNSVPLQFQKDTCQTPRKQVMGCSRTSRESMVVWVG